MKVANVSGKEKNDITLYRTHTTVLNAIKTVYIHAAFSFIIIAATVTTAAAGTLLACCAVSAVRWLILTVRSQTHDAHTFRWLITTQQRFALKPATC